MVSNQLNRRQILKVPLGLALLGGVGAGGVASAVPAGATTPRHLELPDVPGLLGDRLANEFWFTFDQTTLFDPSQEMADALYAVFSYFPPGAEVAIYSVWVEMVKSSDYPENFISYMTPIKQPLTVLSRVQLEVFDQFYCRRDPRIIDAFSYFAQGVLYDPRHPLKPVHTMDGQPPQGYHVWHAFMRAFMFLGIDRRRWEDFNPINAFAWAVQSVAKPSEYQVNPPLPRGTVRQLKRDWLPRRPRRLDIDFQSFPYPEGFEPPPDPQP